MLLIVEECQVMHSNSDDDDNNNNNEIERLCNRENFNTMKLAEKMLILLTWFLFRGKCLIIMIMLERLLREKTNISVKPAERILINA